VDLNFLTLRETFQKRNIVHTVHFIPSTFLYLIQAFFRFLIVTNKLYSQYAQTFAYYFLISFAYILAYFLIKMEVDKRRQICL